MSDSTALPRPLRFRAVAFDLLTALVDSWSLWERVAGDAGAGRRWRERSLSLVTGAGAYRDYEAIVREAAAAEGVPATATDLLIRSWGDLQPYPDAVATVAALRSMGVPMAVVTNTSQGLAEVAAHRLDIGSVVSAERTGFYKPDSRAYLRGVALIGVQPEAVLFVAGSAHDVTGAAAAGLAVYWANRRGLPVPSGGSPIANEPDLAALPGLFDRSRPAI